MTQDKNSPDFLFKCTSCGEIKPNKEFGKKIGQRRVREFDSKCKICKHSVTKQWADRNKDKRKEVSRRYNNSLGKEGRRERYLKYKDTNPISITLSTIKNNAKKRNLPFHITRDWIEHLWKTQNGKCYYTGRSMEFSLGKDNSFSVDRKNSNLGYIEDNTVLCCYRINVVKNNLSDIEFINLCREVINNVC